MTSRSDNVRTGAFCKTSLSCLSHCMKYKRTCLPFAVPLIIAHCLAQSTVICISSVGLPAPELSSFVRKIRKSTPARNPAFRKFRLALSFLVYPSHCHMSSKWTGNSSVLVIKVCATSIVNSSGDLLTSYPAI